MTVGSDSYMEHKILLHEPTVLYRERQFWPKKTQWDKFPINRPPIWNNITYVRAIGINAPRYSLKFLNHVCNSQEAHLHVK